MALKFVVVRFLRGRSPPLCHLAAQNKSRRPCGRRLAIELLRLAALEAQGFDRLRPDETSPGHPTAPAPSGGCRIPPACRACTSASPPVSFSSLFSNSTLRVVVEGLPSAPGTVSLAQPWSSSCSSTVDNSPLPCRETANHGPTRPLIASAILEVSSLAAPSESSDLSDRLRLSVRLWRLNPRSLARTSIPLESSPCYRSPRGQQSAAGRPARRRRDHRNAGLRRRRRDRTLS